MFRTVQITGRPIHLRAVLIPCYQYGLKGYQYIVPLVTKEDENGDNQEGILLNKGFIPESEREIPNRLRLEDVSPQTFTAYVSKLEEYQCKTIFGEGNLAKLEGNRWNSASFIDMSKFS